MLSVETEDVLGAPEVAGAPGAEADNTSASAALLEILTPDATAVLGSISEAIADVVVDTRAASKAVTVGDMVAEAVEEFAMEVKLELPELVDDMEEAVADTRGTVAAPHVLVFPEPEGADVGFTISGEALEAIALDEITPELGDEVGDATALGILAPAPPAVEVELDISKEGAGTEASKVGFKVRAICVEVPFSGDFEPTKSSSS
ncbi:hypothetical protein HGRIS_006488 [Hohenbuehelia grisea]|uniref:Uncharacterized protein n=1 Tax=Hohenbuehelia grisea TaxID=104357 RepID=A0ABR3K036_9AGAR